MCFSEQGNENKMDFAEIAMRVAKKIRGTYDVPDFPKFKIEYAGKKEQTEGGESTGEWPPPLRLKTKIRFGKGIMRGVKPSTAETGKIDKLVDEGVKKILPKFEPIFDKSGLKVKEIKLRRTPDVKVKESKLFYDAYLVFELHGDPWALMGELEKLL